MNDVDNEEFEELNFDYECERDAINDAAPLGMPTECDNCGCIDCILVRGGIECAECGKFYRIQ